MSCFQGVIQLGSSSKRFWANVMGLLKARVGRIGYADQDVTNWPSYRRARGGIGFVPQGRGIFPFLTVRENLVMGLEANPVRDEKEALEEIYNLFPVLKNMAKRMAGTLSGG